MFTNKATQRLRRMLEAIRSKDFTLRFAVENLRGEERLLAEEINSVISEFREKQMQQEAMYGQYELLLNQVDAMLLMDDCRGNIAWMNRQAIQKLCGFTITRLDMLASVHPELPHALESLQPGQQRLLHLHVADREVDWRISMSRYFRMGEEARLFSISNIQSAVQQKEVESQERLVNVLTHEIMNSLSPIISLSDSLAKHWDEMEQDDLKLALNAIHRRGKGLLTFVENYRKLSHISQPNRTEVKVGDIVGDLKQLMPSPYITYRVEIPEETICVDRSQMEQVLINLLKNAMEAVENLPAEERRIELRTKADQQNKLIRITVADNGPGILPETIENIFVPFYTTKANGSGIGLALCRQVVSLHGGIIRVNSKPGKTEFIVEL